MRHNSARLVSRTRLVEVHRSSVKRRQPTSIGKSFTINDQSTATLINIFGLIDLYGSRKNGYARGPPIRVIQRNGCINFTFLIVSVNLVVRWSAATSWRYVTDFSAETGREQPTVKDN